MEILEFLKHLNHHCRISLWDSCKFHGAVEFPWASFKRKSQTPRSWALRMACVLQLVVQLLRPQGSPQIRGPGFLRTSEPVQPFAFCLGLCQLWLLASHSPTSLSTTFSLPRKLGANLPVNHLLLRTIVQSRICRSPQSWLHVWVPQELHNHRKLDVARLQWGPWMGMFNRGLGRCC